MMVLYEFGLVKFIESKEDLWIVLLRKSVWQAFYKFILYLKHWS